MTPPGAETQPERTALAWQRTGLGVLAVGALLGHDALKTRSPLLLAVAGIAALLGLGILGGLAPVRYRHVLRRLAADEPINAPGLVGAATGVVALAAAAAAVAVLVLSLG